MRKREVGERERVGERGKMVGHERIEIVSIALEGTGGT